MIKRAIQILVALFLVGLGGLGVYRWHKEHIWPFSTATSGEAFLGTSFGMSPPEVRRALKKYGALLLSYEDYNRIETSPSVRPLDLIEVLSEHKGRDFSLYMPSIEMYGSKVEAEFTFTEARLTYVTIYFDAILSDWQSVISSVESKLRSLSEFSHREDSKQVPGAYSLHFKKGSVVQSLWVNPRDRIISLNLRHEKTGDLRKQLIERREREALGTRER